MELGRVGLLATAFVVGFLLIFPEPRKTPPASAVVAAPARTAGPPQTPQRSPSAIQVESASPANGRRGQPAARPEVPPRTAEIPARYLSPYDQPPQVAPRESTEEFVRRIQGDAKPPR